MNYRSEIAELTRYFVTLRKIDDVFYNRKRADISRYNPNLHEFLRLLDEIEKEIRQMLPVNSVAFRLKEPVSLLFFIYVRRRFENEQSKIVDVIILKHYDFNPNNRYSYKFVVYYDILDLELLSFTRETHSDIISEEIVKDVPVMPEYDDLSDIINFALNYSVYKKILKPEHLKPYVKLFRALFGEEG